MATAATLLCAPAALADTTSSTNWAGYAVHRSGTSFRAVQATWRQPSAACTRGLATYSSYWVGLGGYNPSSSALEQTGTEVDCTSGGHLRSTAWYELVPAPSVPISLTVQPGDLMSASVKITGNRVSLSLQDITRNRGFAKTVTTSAVDVASAEWIAEAPSECVNANLCQTLPLANFGTAEFDSALVTSKKGHVGGITDSAWNATKINLMPQGGRFFIGNGATAPVGAAAPSALAPGGHAFKVSYSQLSVTTGGYSARSASVARAGYLLHPAR